ncbi:MAG TPA: transglutaminase-like domain-containing protein [archaeon]|nr:transglutaminase-like domain-containing protein [archaeon]
MQHTKNFLKILTILIFLTTTIYAQNIYPTTISEMTLQITLGGNGRISELEKGEEVKFQTLTFQETPYQKILEINEELIINGNKIKPIYTYDEFDNKYALFTITENGDFNYKIIAKIKTSAQIHEITDYNISNYNEKITEFTKDSEKVESNSLEILTLAKNKLINESFLDSINKTIFWVNEYVEYATGDDFKTYYLLQKSAIETLLEKKGVCDEFANLAASILRSKNIPTRIIIGITFDGIEWGNHAWIEIFHKDLGWVPSDPTFREIGFVDGTHIKIGSFKDITQSLAKATYPKTTSVNFQTQTLPIIEIIDFNYFNEVKIETKNTDVKTNQWNEIILDVTNLTEKKIIVPLTIRENYKEILIQDKSKSIILNPKEKGNITFSIYPIINLKLNELAKGNITFNSLSNPYSKEITITQGNQKDDEKIVINDITPITTQKEILIDITTTNYSSKENNIDINVNNNDKNYYWIEKISPFTKQNFRKKIENNQQKQEIIIETKTEKVTQTFYPLTQIIEKQEEPKETTVVQKIDTKKENNQDITKTIIENPQIILFALLPAIAIIIFGLFLTKKQYI